MNHLAFYDLIGLMSGTSLDGIDLAACRFTHQQEHWNFEILHAETIPYTPQWETRLQEAPSLSGLELTRLHTDYGHLLGRTIAGFCQRNALSPLAVASHGHTVFHQPENGFTLQIGDPAAIAVESGLTTVADFRTTDVALGGQGAPLVPLGDALLFASYPVCLNLGGIANLSFEREGQRHAYDICPCNMGLNRISQTLGKPYDSEGKWARSGHVDTTLLTRLNSLEFYDLKGPKSLGFEWFSQVFEPCINQASLSAIDCLATLSEHIALQIARACPTNTSEILCTGGGAFNDFLLERITALSGAKTTRPSVEIIQYKEALIFAFLGLLRLLEQPNTWSSVTGGRHNSCGGGIYRAS